MRKKEKAAGCAVRKPTRPPPPTPVTLSVNEVRDLKKKKNHKTKQTLLKNRKDNFSNDVPLTINGRDPVERIANNETGEGAATGTD